MRSGRTGAGTVLVGEVFQDVGDRHPMLNVRESTARHIAAARRLPRLAHSRSAPRPARRPRAAAGSTCLPRCPPRPRRLAQAWTRRRVRMTRRPPCCARLHVESCVPDVFERIGGQGEVGTDEQTDRRQLACRRPTDRPLDLGKLYAPSLSLALGKAAAGCASRFGVGQQRRSGPKHARGRQCGHARAPTVVSTAATCRKLLRMTPSLRAVRCNSSGTVQRKVA